MKKYGFYCYMYGRDCFVETTQTRKTDKLAKDFIYSVQFELGKKQFANDEDIEYIKKSMSKATFEVKTIKNGNFAGLSYYEIKGENFSFGSDAWENPLKDCVLIKF